MIIKLMLKKCFRQKGYDQTLIDQAVDKANNVDREVLLYPPPKHIENRVTFVSEYCTASM